MAEFDAISFDKEGGFKMLFENSTVAILDCQPGEKNRRYQPFCGEAFSI